MGVPRREGDGDLDGGYAVKNFLNLAAPFGGTRAVSEQEEKIVVSHKVETRKPSALLFDVTMQRCATGYQRFLHLPEGAFNTRHLCEPHHTGVFLDGGHECAKFLIGLSEEIEQRQSRAFLKKRRQLCPYLLDAVRGV